MSQLRLVGHQTVIDKFAHWLGQGRLASTWLFAGRDGIGKKVMAVELARALLCEGTSTNELVSCGQCSSCQQVDARTHPDLLMVGRPPEKNLIPIELLIGSRDQRMRAGLCHDIALKPYRGGRRVAIIDDADFLNQEGANCLLKTLEEPPAFALIILISGSEHRQLSTIRSRCQIVRFQPLTPEQIRTVLREKQLLEDTSLAGELSLACAGSLQLALQLADRDTFEFRRSLLEQLASLDPGSEDFADSVGSFVDAAGKDAAARRDRLRLVAELASQFYRNVMTGLCGQEFVADDIMQHQVLASVNRWPGDADSAANCINRCGIVREQVAANANQVLVIASLLADLGKIVRGEMCFS